MLGCWATVSAISDSDGCSPFSSSKLSSTSYRMNSMRPCARSMKIWSWEQLSYKFSDFGGLRFESFEVKPLCSNPPISSSLSVGEREPLPKLANEPPLSYSSISSFSIYAHN